MTYQHQKRIRKYLSIVGSLLLAGALLIACGGATTNAGLNEAPTPALPTIHNTAGVGIEPTIEGTVPVVPEISATGMDATPLTVAEVMENPDAYIGQEVTIVGEAQQMFGSNAFKLDEESLLGSGLDSDLPVLGAEEGLFETNVNWLNDQVQVTGTLRAYVQAEFERDFDWFTPGEGWTAEVEENQPVLIADSVTPVR